LKLQKNHKPSKSLLKIYLEVLIANLILWRSMK
jgi:hypothetical protein